MCIYIYIYITSEGGMIRLETLVIGLGRPRLEESSVLNVLGSQSPVYLNWYNNSK